MVRGEHTGVIGAGIVGLAVARRLQQVRPGAPVTVWDKEKCVGTHQTGHNSGVVHAGIYYEPGSLKAELCRRGGAMLRDFCADHGVAVTELGKVVVAVSEEERPRLEAIFERGRRNGVPDLAWLDAGELRRVEPWAAGVAAVHSPHTAVVDYRAVAAALAGDVEAAGGTIHLGRPVRGITSRAGAVVVTDAEGRGTAVDRLVVCAGLGTDALASAAGFGRHVRTVAFRGEYHRLGGESRDRVKGLIYPVPDPRYPFLGVHLTRTAAGDVLVGPNAVPALAVEGYRRRDVDATALARWVAWSGGRRLARDNWRAGMAELRTSLSKAAFAAAARRYLPSLHTGDLQPAPAGVRAQAVDAGGRLLDDFVVDVSGPVAVVRNAPSPAATSSLAIAEHLAERLLAAGR
jgi:L-2-hydroxyglutarate oxidase